VKQKIYKRSTNHYYYSAESCISYRDKGLEPAHSFLIGLQFKRSAVISKSLFVSGSCSESCWEARLERKQDSRRRVRDSAQEEECETVRMDSAHVSHSSSFLVCLPSSLMRSCSHCLLHLSHVSVVWLPTGERIFFSERIFWEDMRVNLQRRRFTRMLHASHASCAGTGAMPE